MTALVAILLPKFRHPDLGEQLAEAFRNRFLKRTGRSLSADEVFLELMQFAGGARVSVPQHQVEVLAILSYLLARCDLLENGEES